VQLAEKVTRYRHAQLSAIKLAGDINAKNFNEAARHRSSVDFVSPMCPRKLLRDFAGQNKNQIRSANGVFATM
jgi:hypothetical protein